MQLMKVVTHNNRWNYWEYENSYKLESKLISKKIEPIKDEKSSGVSS
jgi:hypothetical protein